MLRLVRIGTAAMASVVVLALVSAALASPVGAQELSPPPGITVVSEGTATAVPDQATVRLGVQVTRPTAGEAINEANRVTDAILARLAALGVPRQNVQTSGISLFPIIRAPEGEAETVTGYRADSQLSVVVTDLPSVGQIIDAAIGSGANQVGGVQFGFQNESTLRAQALRSAAEGARAKADAIAAGLGMRVGRILEVREESNSGGPFARAEGAGRDAAIAPGQLTVRARLQVTFEMTSA